MVKWGKLQFLRGMASDFAKGKLVTMGYETGIPSPATSLQILTMPDYGTDADTFSFNILSRKVDCLFWSEIYLWCFVLGRLLTKPHKNAQKCHKNPEKPWKTSFAIRCFDFFVPSCCSRIAVCMFGTLLTVFQPKGASLINFSPQYTAWILWRRSPKTGRFHLLYHVWQGVLVPESRNCVQNQCVGLHRRPRPNFIWNLQSSKALLPG